MLYFHCPLDLKSAHYSGVGQMEVLLSLNFVAPACLIRSGVVPASLLPASDAWTPHTSRRQFHPSLPVRPRARQRADRVSQGPGEWRPRVGGGPPTRRNPFCFAPFPRVSHCFCIDGYYICHALVHLPKESEIREGKWGSVLKIFGHTRGIFFWRGRCY